jgi:hypothetical protein
LRCAGDDAVFVLNRDSEWALLYIDSRDHSFVPLLRGVLECTTQQGLIHGTAGRMPHSVTRLDAPSASASTAATTRPHVLLALSAWHGVLSAFEFGEAWTAPIDEFPSAPVPADSDSPGSSVAAAYRHLEFDVCFDDGAFPANSSVNVAPIVSRLALASPWSSPPCGFSGRVGARPPAAPIASSTSLHTASLSRPLVVDMHFQTTAASSSRVDIGGRPVLALLCAERSGAGGLFHRVSAAASVSSSAREPCLPTPTDHGAGASEPLAMHLRTVVLDLTEPCVENGPVTVSHLPLASRFAIALPHSLALIPTPRELVLVSTCASALAARRREKVSIAWPHAPVTSWTHVSPRAAVSCDDTIARPSCLWLTTESGALIWVCVQSGDSNGGSPVLSCGQMSVSPSLPLPLTSSLLALPLPSPSEQAAASTAYSSLAYSSAIMPSSSSSSSPAPNGGDTSLSNRAASSSLLLWPSAAGNSMVLRANFPASVSFHLSSSVSLAGGGTSSIGIAAAPSNSNSRAQTAATGNAAISSVMPLLPSRLTATPAAGASRGALVSTAAANATKAAASASSLGGASNAAVGRLAAAAKAIADAFAQNQVRVQIEVRIHIMPL